MLSITSPWHRQCSDLWTMAVAMQKPAANTSKRMAATRPRDNPRELAVRSALHRIGLRYRIHQRLIPGSSRTADLVFPRHRLAVFLDGCFWHGCPLHGTSPKTNSDWWTEKLKTNKERDRSTNEILRAAGWSVLRIWEHVPLDEAIMLIRAELTRSAYSASSRSRLQVALKGQRQ